MPKNISTTLEGFVNENITKTKRVNKNDIKSAVLECLSKSDRKLSMGEIGKITGQKTDNVYIALIDIAEAKSKKCNDILYWYINESQVDPPKKVRSGVGIKPVDPLFMKIYEDDKNSSDRKIFLSMEDHQEYIRKQNEGKDPVPARKPLTRARKSVAKKSGPTRRKK